MNRSRFAYFLNAIHYCIWLNDIKFGDFIGRIVDVVLSPIPKLFFTKKYRKKYESRLPQAQKIMNEILNTGNNIKEIETLTLFGKLNNRRIELIKQNNEVYK